ncbi:MAG: type VI secretion system tip protein TssI/VgrG [Planctomycetota bacterium]
MSPSLSADRASFHLRVGPYDEDELAVLRFRSKERISDPFELRVELASREPDLDFSSVVGAPASFRLSNFDSARFLHGVVTEFRQSGRSRNHFFYDVVVRPALWLLSQRENCRIFQEVTVEEIVSEILEEHGLSKGLDFKFKTRSNYLERVYCVQYRESDLDFVSRLLEEEGISYSFRSDDTRSCIEFSDGSESPEPIDGSWDLRLAPPDGMVADELSDQITAFKVAESVRPGAIAMTDYKFERPSLDLASRSESDKHQALEIFEYPGVYQEAPDGKKLAQVRLEEVQASRVEAVGQSNCIRFEPGRTYELTEHERTSYNRGYLITELIQEGASPQALEEDAATGSEGRYSNDFVSIPDDVPFRPERRTPRPIVRGSQTAVVVGPSGEEIYTDEHGRVKVQFFWDRYGGRDHTSSCWIRCSQPWAGPGWGGLAIPRIGQEVVIDFLEGNPDRPLIVGRVYNGEIMPPQTLPDAKANMTIRSQSLGGSGGSNEITMGDSGGQESFYMHAQYDMTEVVENDHSVTVNANETTTVAIDRTENVGNNETITIAVDRTESVGSNESVSIGASRSLSVGTSDSQFVGASQSVSVGASQSVSVGASQSTSVGGSANESVAVAKMTSVGAAYALNVGAAMNVAVGGASFEEVGGLKKIIAGSSLELICGGSSIKLESSGKITIKGKEISIEGAGPVKVKGSTIDLN